MSALFDEEIRMLWEDEVIEYTIQYLKSKGYKIRSSSDVYSRGTDIVAEKDGVRLYVEAKGQTSSKPGTRRFGKEFNRNQKTDHVSKAIYSALKSKNQHANSHVGIALPADEIHIELIEAVWPSLKQLNISVFLVSESGKIHLK